MSQLGIPANLQALCGTNGIINLSWVDTPPTCDAALGSAEVDCTHIQCTLNNSLGDVIWGITGQATISQSGLITAPINSEGILVITATDSCCGMYTIEIQLISQVTLGNIINTTCTVPVSPCAPHSLCDEDAPSTSKTSATTYDVVGGKLPIIGTERIKDCVTDAIISTTDVIIITNDSMRINQGVSNNVPCQKKEIWYTDACGRVSSPPIQDRQPCTQPVITGTDGVLKNNQYQYSVASYCGTPVWTVSGTDVSINQNGLLTVGPNACGMAVIGINASNCHGCATLSVRVTDGGVWSLISTQDAAAPSGTYATPGAYGCNSTNCQSCLGGGNGTWGGQCGCNVISGAYRTDYYTTGVCLCQVSQSGYDSGYRNGVFPSAGSAPCTGGKPDNPCLGTCGCNTDSFGGIPRICSSTSYTFVTYKIEIRQWVCP